LLVHVGELHRRTDANLPGVGRLCAGEHAKQRGLAGAVRTDDADDRPARDRERQVVYQQPIAEALAQVLDLDHQVAEARAGRDVDLIGLIALLELTRSELLVARQARLALGLPRLGIGAHPFELARHGLLERRAL